MRISVIGATGMVGSRLVTEATTRGHRVTAAARTPRASTAAGIVSVAVDANEPRTLTPLFDRVDAVVLAVRPGAGREHTLAALTTTVLDAARAAGTPVVVIGGAGPLASPNGPGLRVVDDPAYVPAQWRTIAAASLAQLRACRDHPGVAWTYLSPPAVLEPGERTGRYRRGTTTLLTDPDGTSRISAEDLAVAALDELEQPGTDRHFTVAQAPA